MSTMIESQSRLEEALKRKREVETLRRIFHSHSLPNILRIQSVPNEMTITSSRIKSWKCYSNNLVAIINVKKLRMKAAKFLVIGNLTINLVNREINQNSKLKVKEKVMDLWSKINRIKAKSKFHLQGNLWTQLTVQVTILKASTSKVIDHHKIMRKFQI